MEFIEYLKHSASPHHVTAASADMLKNAGFTELKLNEAFDVKPGGKYFVKVYSTALAAFTVGRNVSEDSTFHAAAAHTDHPCLHIKPDPEMDSKGNGGWMKLNTEMYSGSIYSTWLDRPLSVAGLVALKSDDPFTPNLRLFDFKRPVAVIPNLAIHFNREVNKGVALNQQTDMIPVLGMFNEKINDGHYLLSAIAKEMNVEVSDILDLDLYVYCCDEPRIVGLNSDMLSSPALDNLTSCYALVSAISAAESSKNINIALLFDHEEIGSRTKTGADSAVFKTILEKIWSGLGFKASALNDAILSGFLFSVDVGHATHPNHPEKYDSVNKIAFGEGIAIKVSSNQRYTLDPSAIATAKMLCEAAGVKHKKFMIRADIPGGSTIGPMLSSLLPMHTVDIGVPILAMHSSCELMQASDEDELVKLMTKFYSGR
ncbi:MAG: M18 family aminopeptidase [Lachnospiraceae bacterium]|nr:M18 family aminopeptidase [Lachnospiraceae bacterium]